MAAAVYTLRQTSPIANLSNALRQAQEQNAAWYCRPGRSHVDVSLGGDLSTNATSDYTYMTWGPWACSSIFQNGLPRCDRCSRDQGSQLLWCWFLLLLEAEKRKKRGRSNRRDQLWPFAFVSPSVFPSLFRHVYAYVCATKSYLGSTLV